jgi:DNA-binding NtrC family response regulator
METLEQIKRPSKAEQKVAIDSYGVLAAAIEQISSEQTEIEIEETKEKIKIPSRALKLLGDILKAMGEGKPISIVPIATEVTTQKAAEILGLNRNTLRKKLQQYKID